MRVIAPITRLPVCLRKRCQKRFIFRNLTNHFSRKIGKMVPAGRCKHKQAQRGFEIQGIALLGFKGDSALTVTHSSKKAFQV